MSSYGFTLPFALLVPDNKKSTIARGRIILSKRYRGGKLHAVAALMRQKQGPTLSGSLALTATLYAPDKRRRDILNHAKMIGDCLTQAGIIKDDSLLDDVRWLRGPIDRENPRLELTVATR